MITMPTSTDAQMAASQPISEGSLVDLSHDVLGGLFRLHQTHGPIAELRDSEAGQSVVCVFSPELNKEVLSKPDRFQARFFSIRGPKRSSQRRVTCGLLAMNGPQHKRNRRVVKEPFGPKAIQAYQPTIEQLAREEVATWSHGQAFDFNEVAIRYMLRVTSRLLFGLDEAGLVYELGEQIAQWVNMNHELGVGALTSTPEFKSGYEDLLSFAEELEANVRELIQRRRANADPEARDVLSLLLRSYEQEEGLSEQELVGQCCVLFAAAHMTTAHSITWTTFLLSQHPEIARSLWEQIRSGTVNNEHPNGAPSLLERTIRESMRVLPASAYSVRINAEPDRLGPLELQRGTPILFTPLITHRLESTFEDPKRFLPGRWLTANPSPYEYLPFGGGPRRCIGGPLAMQVIRTTLPVFFADWQLRLQPQAKVAAEIRSTMLNPKHGMAMIAERHDRLEEHERFVATDFDGNLNQLVDLPQAPARPTQPR